ncbi:hypothetical protein TNCV_3732271 [Trichonephila clavipes]|nr:hypothetical protein TNCV_3732271 [Trichonephila clavipes]
MRDTNALKSRIPMAIQVVDLEMLRRTGLEISHLEYATGWRIVGKPEAGQSQGTCCWYLSVSAIVMFTLSKQFIETGPVVLQPYQGHKKTPAEERYLKLQANRQDDENTCLGQRMIGGKLSLVMNRSSVWAVTRHVFLSESQY